LKRQHVIERMQKSQGQLARRSSMGAAISLVNCGGLDVGLVEARNRRGDHELNDINMRPPTLLVPAAVLVPLVSRPDGFTILLTERAADMRSHAGQISFPGGRIDPEDASPEHAALREAHEEIGMPHDAAEVIGRLDTYDVRTGFAVTPVVGIVEPGFEMIYEPGEVADVFEVPLSFILDPANHERHNRLIRGKRRYFYALPFEKRYIWGATAGMLINLYEVLTGQTARWR
jgi:8-oxo-dGTP pyrophosphatase MutT (NUDIX family)